MGNGRNSEDFSWNLIWEIKASPRVAFFAGDAVRGYILTVDNLIRRGKVTVNGC